MSLLYEKKTGKTIPAPRFQDKTLPETPDKFSLYTLPAPLSFLMFILQPIGRAFLLFTGRLGKVTLFVLQGVSHCFRPPWYGRLFLRQCLEIGFYSLPLVSLTAIFTGMVLALQSHTGFSRFAAEGAVPQIVALSITRELGPVLAGLMVAGRIGAAIAAELGSMRTSEQIDALSTLSTHPIKYLVVPRFLAATLVLPILVAVADIIGILGGYLVSVTRLGFHSELYLHNTLDFLQAEDILSGLVKAAIFGFITAAMGCYHGYHASGGAQGVGKATTYAVVSSSILILCCNYLVTVAFFGE